MIESVLIVLFQYFDHHDRNLLAFFNRVSLDVLGMNCRVSVVTGARCSSVVRAFAHGAMGRRIDPSWGEPIELFLVPASAPAGFLSHCQNSP